MEKNTSTEPVQSARSGQTRLIQEEIIDRASAGFQPLPMLDIIFSRMATEVASTLKSRAGLIASVSFDSISYETWGAIVSGVDPYGICAIAEARPWGGTLAVVMDRHFIFAALEAQMGGMPRPESVPERPASQIEQQVSRHTVSLILSDLSHNFSRVAEATFVIDSMEPPQQMSAIHGGGTSCVLARLNVRIGDCIGSFSIIIPFETLGPVQDKLSKMFLGDKLGADTSWREHILANISGSNVTVAARLHEMRVPITDVLGWKPGETIDLGILPDQEVTLMCSGIPVLHGYAGRVRNGNIALRVTRDGDDTGSNGEIQEGVPQGDVSGVSDEAADPETESA